MNQAEFAKLHDVSKKTVTKWKEQGWLVLCEDGSVDVEASNANIKRYRKTVTRGNQGNSQGNRKGNSPKVTVPAVAEADETPAQAAERIITNLGGGNLSIDEAKCLKENYLALLTKLEYEAESKSLVELSVAQSVMFKMARQQRDAWMNWPTSVGAKIAAKLDVDPDKLIELLTAHVHDQITKLGDPDEDAFFKDED